MIGSIQFGFSLSFNVISLEGIKKKYPNYDYSKDEFKIEIYNNFPSLFGCIGGFIICFVTNFLSYKKTLFLYGFINTILWLLYLAFKPTLMIFGIVLRILQGLITSGFGCLIPVYLTSICPDDTAGFFGSLQQIGIASGLVIFLFLSAFINYQIVAIIGAVIEFIFCCLFWLMPTEKKERDKESIYKRDYALNIFVGMMLMFFQQFCGINALLGNLNKIMSKSGIDINPSLQSEKCKCLLFSVI